MPPHPPVRKQDTPIAWRHAFGVFAYSRRAASLVWSTNRALTVWLLLLSLVAGTLPAGVAYLGKLIVDAIVLAIETGSAADRDGAFRVIALEFVAVALLAGVQRGIGMCRSLLRAQLGHRVNVLILQKALTLDLAQFEDSTLYDRMTQARREASARPLSLVMRTFGLLQDGISLVSYGALLIAFSPWAALVLAVAAIPAFIAETRFSGEAFRLFRWRTPETRQQMYLETVIAREDYAKELKIFGLGPRLLQRYRDIFQTLYKEDRSLTLRRGIWGTLLGWLSTATFYGAYGWIAWSTVVGTITLGDMTMYLLVFKQGQSAMGSALTAIGGLYEDNLYISNLYEFLDQDVERRSQGATEGTKPGDGIRFEGVGFVYPGAEEPAIDDVTFQVPAGCKLALVGGNGSGKTTLIKLLARLYRPTSGRILLDGLDLEEWDGDALRKRIGVIFQDFVRYQFTVGQNIGVGDSTRFDDPERWQVAATKGMAAEFIDALPAGYETQLGRWFEKGRELSLGQWQKVALSRAFMSPDADILVLDEPTASMDPEAEIEIFKRFNDMSAGDMAIVISHRFSTVRVADRIVVLNAGRIAEEGDHDSLMREDGIYARLFTLQAEAYR